MIQSPRHVGTIGSTIASDLHMSIYCDRRIEGKVCGHSAKVDLEALRQKFGADYPVADFVVRSRCAQCGGKWPDVTVRVGPNNTGPAWARG